MRVYDEVSATPPGMGVHFIELDASAAQVIDDFLSQRNPLHYEGG